MFSTLSMKFHVFVFAIDVIFVFLYIMQNYIISDICVIRFPYLHKVCNFFIHCTIYYSSK